MEIKKEYCGINGSEEWIIQKPVLQGEIDNLDTYYTNIPEGRLFHIKPAKSTINIFLFTQGAGEILQGDQQFAISEVALFVPDISKDVNINAQNGNLEMLEIVLQISENDLLEIQNRQNLFPYFTAYSNCKKYKEAIKSDKTINRMILPEKIVPRFCMGSVKTNGPDEVGVHKHPMLEQLFFGLEENNCIVIADETHTSFKENVLLHIPLGSEHGVKVEEGKILNYIWMDFFRNKEDMNYMAENHIMEE